MLFSATMSPEVKALTAGIQKIAENDSNRTTGNPIETM
jgi:hypothetical protein